MKRYLAAAMLLLALSGCGSSGSSTQLYTTTEDFFAMDTYMSVDVSSEKSESAAEDMAVKIEQRVNQLDAALSRTQQAGDLYKLNHANGQPTEVSDDTYTALEKALEYAEMTNGAFDPTMAPLTDLWGIGTDNARVPAQSEIDEALTHVGYQNVKLLRQQSGAAAERRTGRSGPASARATQATSCTKWRRAIPRTSGTFWRG